MINILAMTYLQDVSSPVLQVDLGRVIVPINPAPELQPADNEQTLSIGSSNFNHNNSHSVKSYTLMFNVICQVDKAAEPQVNGLVNGEVNGEHSKLFSFVSVCVPYT